MNRYGTILLVIAFFISCSSDQRGAADAAGDTTRSVQTAAAAGYVQIRGDSVLLPPFEIEVSLSTRANAQLLRDKESIIVAAWFSGKPIDTTSKEYAESGELFIKSWQVELDSNRVAKFEGIRFSKAAYDSLADKDIRVLVNVFSGRRSSPDNLLDCHILSDKMSAVNNRTFVLTGKLIGEPDSLIIP